MAVFGKIETKLVVKLETILALRNIKFYNKVTKCRYIWQSLGCAL